MGKKLAKHKGESVTQCFPKNTTCRFIVKTAVNGDRIQMTRSKRLNLSLPEFCYWTCCVLDRHLMAGRRSRWMRSHPPSWNPQDFLVEQATPLQKDNKQFNFGILPVHALAIEQTYPKGPLKL